MATQRTSQQIKSEIEARMGFFPSFFAPALSTPSVLESLWHQQLTADIDNPMPFLLKNKILARLSRYCAIPYVLVSRSCALKQEGLPEDDILALLKQSMPVSIINLEDDLSVLRASPRDMDLWPAAGSALEKSFIRCTEFIFLDPHHSWQCRVDIRRVLSGQNDAWWALLLLYARSSHLWAETHPDISPGNDTPLVEQCRTIAQNKTALVDFFTGYNEAVRQERRTLEDLLTAQVAQRMQMSEELTRYVGEVESSRDRLQEQASRLAKQTEELNQQRTELLNEVAERKKAEESIRVFEEIVRHMPIGLTVWHWENRDDPKSFRLIAANPASNRFLGTDLLTSIGKTLSEVLPDQAAGRAPAYYNQVVLLGEERDLGEAAYESAPETKGVYSVKAFPLPNRCLAITYQDITDRKAAEVELARARDAALELVRVRSGFLANMSHEIRTPLNAVIGMNNLLLDTPLTPQQKDFAKTAAGAGEALLSLINDILDFSKMESAKMALERLDFDLKEVTQTALDILAPRARAKGLDLSSDLAPDVPTLLTGDPTRLRQILINLLSNAVKFTDAGSVTLRITKEEESPLHTALTFSIQDTGIGISTEEKRRLFQAFVQADTSTTRKYGGTGLGLAICKQLVELMGGDIGVDSERGHGSTFWVRARFEKQLSGKAARREEAPAAPSSAHPHHSHLRVLVVEDNPVNQKVAQLQLEKLGYMVDIVDSGPGAIEAVEKKLYNLIFMDCQMPGMDGYEATALLRKQQGSVRHTPIIAMTAHTLPADRQKCLTAGMDDFLTKPVKMEELSAMLSKWDKTLDDTALKNMRDMAGKESPKFIGAVIDRFLADTPDRLRIIGSAVQKNDFTVLEQMSHTLKGSSGNLGASHMWTLCEQLEEMGRLGKAEKAMEILNELTEEFEKTRAALLSEKTRG